MSYLTAAGTQTCTSQLKAAADNTTAACTDMSYFTAVDWTDMSYLTDVNFTDMS
jgi:hypothetical protein